MDVVAQEISTPLVTVDTGSDWLDFFMIAALLLLIAAISVGSKVAVDRLITRRELRPAVSGGEGRLKGSEASKAHDEPAHAPVDDSHVSSPPEYKN